MELKLTSVNTAVSGQVYEEQAPVLLQSQHFLKQWIYTSVSVAMEIKLSYDKHHKLLTFSTNQREIPKRCSLREEVIQGHRLSLFPHCFQGAARHRWKSLRHVHNIESSYFCPNPTQLATSLCLEQGRWSVADRGTCLPRGRCWLPLPGTGTATISLWKLRTFFSINDFSFELTKSSEFNQKCLWSVTQT